MILAELESADVATIWQAICAAAAFSITVVTVTIYRYSRKQQEHYWAERRRTQEIEARQTEREWHDKMLAVDLSPTPKEGESADAGDATL